MKKRSAHAKRLFRSDDLCQLRQVTGAAISPDGRRVIYAIETMSADKRKYFSNLYMADTAGGESKQFTFGEVSDRGMVWSSDGKQIAFVSTRDKKTGIYIISSEGGAEQKIFEADGSFSNLLWTPDSSSLIYQFRYNDSHHEPDEKKKGEAPVYRHITRLFYRLDGSGFLPQDRYHLWRLDIASGKTRQLTRGKRDEVDPALSADGRWLAYVSNVSPDPDLESLKIDLFVMPSDGGKARKIGAPPGPKGMPSFSPDGKKIAYVGHANPNDAWGVTNFHVWTVGLSGSSAAKDLLHRFDRQTFDQTGGDMGEGEGGMPPVWSADGKKIFFAASDTGCTHIFYVPAGGGLPTRITKKSCHIKGYSFDKRRSRIAAVYSDLSTPGELHLIPAEYNGDRKAKAITSSNTSLFSEINQPKVREIWFKAHDGTELQGWLVTPPKFNRNKKYPAILEIHGGPRIQYGFSYYYEMLYLASRGYVVFYTNPRGGAGRGETFAGTIVADWGGIDYLDCMAAADYLEKLPYVNKNRVGVTGGSYGGYMTAWIVGHTDRFRAAVTQRAVVDLTYIVGSSDIGYEFAREFEGLPWTAPETYVRCSPITYAKNIRTPLLIIHSEQDLRCDISQAEQLFVMLKLLKRRVEFIRFPEEPHGLSRHGRPDRRVARLDWIVKWFDRYMR